MKKVLLLILSFSAFNAFAGAFTKTDTIYAEWVIPAGSDKPVTVKSSRSSQKIERLDELSDIQDSDLTNNFTSFSSMGSFKDKKIVFKGQHIDSPAELSQPIITQMEKEFESLSGRTKITKKKIWIRDSRCQTKGFFNKKTYCSAEFVSEITAEFLEDASLAKDKKMNDLSRSMAKDVQPDSDLPSTPSRATSSK